jgi:DNA-directed RNA polymerase subunit M/transcription elongation factor TFIIS
MAQIETEQQHITKVSPYCCHNCNSSMYISIQRHRIDNLYSLQFWTCNKCGFKWKEIWLSPSNSIWSSQY